MCTKSSVALVKRGSPFGMAKHPDVIHVPILENEPKFVLLHLYGSHLMRNFSGMSSGYMTILTKIYQTQTLMYEVVQLFIPRATQTEKEILILILTSMILTYEFRLGDTSMLLHVLFNFRYRKFKKLDFCARVIQN